MNNLIFVDYIDLNWLLSEEACHIYGWSDDYYTSYKNFMKDFYYDRNVQIFGAKLSGRIVGIMIFTKSTIKWIGVHGDYRFRGIGKFMIQQLASLYKDDRFMDVRIWAHPYKSSIDFFRKCGFSVMAEGEIQDITGPIDVIYDCYLCPYDYWWDFVISHA